MPKPRRYRSQAATVATTSEQFAKGVNGLLTLDAFQNFLARTGFGTPSLMEATAYPLTRMTRDYNTLNALYRNSWLARRIIDLVPKDMTKNGWKYDGDIAPEKIDMLEKSVRQTRLKQNILRGLNWGRLYGGAAGLMLIEGQEDILAEPLDVETILPGDFKGLLVVDRWAGAYPESELIADISSPEFGLPEWYQFRDSAQQVVSRVHHSRIIRFVGDDLPEWEAQAETHWGASIIESVFEEIKKRDNTSANLANLIFLANLRVMKMEDLGQILGASTDTAKTHLYSTITAQNQLMSNFGIYLMSKEDDFQQFQLNNFAGINDVYESFMLDVAGAAQIPVTKLFGRAPAGLNSTGESDLRNYYDVIESDQESRLRPVLEKLLPVLCASVLGEIPEDIGITFNPLETPSEKDQGDAVKWRSDAVYGAHDRGIISDQTALKELKQMADGTGLFSNITDEDIESAEDEPFDAAAQMALNAGAEGDSNGDESPKKPGTGAE